jgi:hypothetical protein
MERIGNGKMKFLTVFLGLLQLLSLTLATTKIKFGKELLVPLDLIFVSQSSVRLFLLYFMAMV